MTRSTSWCGATLLLLGLLPSCARGAPPASSPAITTDAARPESAIPARGAERPSADNGAPTAPVSLDNDVEARQMAELEKAQHLLEEFIARAGDDPEFAEAVERSRERIADIEAIRDFWSQGRREREAAGH